MASSAAAEKPHAVCIPYPAQGHINPMLALAKLLHSHGFHITFVNTDYNHRRLLRSHSAAALDGLPGFRFASIPDGLPPSEADATQDIPSLSSSTATTCLEPFCRLLADLNSDPESPPVSCVVSDGVMSFTLAAAERFRLPEVLFWTCSACGLLAYCQYRRLIDEGLVPLKEMEQVSNGYLETVVDGVAGMECMRLRDFPSFIRTTDAGDTMLNFLIQESDAVPRGRALILNTFDALEQRVLAALSEISPPIYTIGPLHMRLSRLPDNAVKAIGSSLWKENRDCIDWLDARAPGSVVYVNFESITTVTGAQLTEFAWGLANSGHQFLWVIRPDIVSGELEFLPEEFVTETKGRGLLASWCQQEAVLGHRAIGGFLTHSGWNSTVESIASGVPMVCWPFFAEQQTNCRFSCVEWGVGMEIDKDVKRDEVETLVRELMAGEKGARMRDRAAEWQRSAEAALAPGGSSDLNFNRLIQDLLFKS